jgi:hypothetical protein
MPSGTATTTTVSRPSLLPPRARHRRLATTTPARMPTMMHRAYARIGKPPTSQTARDGLGMDSRVSIRG